MKLYPWLVEPYKNIIKQHRINKAHHAILIKTPKGMGAFRLIWFVSRWLLCKQPIGFNFCNTCRGCKLMHAHNHPDWHHVMSEKHNIFGIDDIRTINKKILKCSQQGGAKIIVLSDTAKLTESAINTLLKILEEPPKNTWFFLVSYKNNHLHDTLNSRCLVYQLFIPKEKISLSWLEQEIVKKNKLHLTTLRINQGSPIFAKQFIEGNIWIERINFYKLLYNSFRDSNLLQILSTLHEKNTLVKIDWICLLFFDVIKFNFKETNNLINLDQITFIELLSNKYTNTTLDASIRAWMRCKHKLLNIPGINYELLLLEQLLAWEKILDFALFV